MVSTDALLKKLGLERPEDLLTWFPLRHEDRARWTNPFTLPDGSWVTLKARLVASSLQRWRGGRAVVRADWQPEGTFQVIRTVWFNMPFIKKALEPSRVAILYGKLATQAKIRVMTHPEMEWVEEDQGGPPVHVDRIVPVYPLREGVSQRALRRRIFDLLGQLPPDESLPWWNQPEWPPRSWALRQVHFPDSFENLNRARSILAFEELLLMQLAVLRRRMRRESIRLQRPVEEQPWVRVWRESLPFSPTGAQLRCMEEIDQDLSRDRPMNRLLQGDVGSGKTLVALHALLRNASRGLNGALLAPTEILAQQHVTKLRELLGPIPVRVEICTAAAQRSVTSALEESWLFGREAVIWVGTHALLQSGVRLDRLGLVVIDEQHKFGVKQRAALVSKGSSPDVLVMTATPIPRTYALTLYGDLEVSILDEMPPGRRPVKTVVRREEDLGKVWEFLARELDAGRQAFVVYPVVEEGGSLGLKAVRGEVEKLASRFGAQQVRMLHGSMKAEEKWRLMEDFRLGKFGVLVASTVVEVGVDVPKASLMVVEHAERFGLAQLHQLRGRVGRGTARSFCVLVAHGGGETAWQRLRALETNQDGFALAEEDLRIRGPGDVLGTDQSGLPPLRLARLPEDFLTLEKARKTAAQILADDPELQKHARLAQALSRWEGQLTPEAAN